MALIASASNSGAASYSTLWSALSANVQVGDVLVTLVTWKTTAADVTFTSGGPTWTQIFSNGSSALYKAAGYHVVTAANSSMPTYAEFTNGGSAQVVPDWTIITLQYRGLHATPFVNYSSATATATSVSVAGPDPGADGGVTIGFLTSQTGQGFTAGSGFTVRAGQYWAYGEDKETTIAGAVTTAGTVSSSDVLTVDAIVFKNPVSASPQRIKVTSTGAGMQSKTGIGGYVWNSTGTTRLSTFTGLVAQATLSGGNSILYITATGLGLTNGDHVLVSAYNSTEGTVGLADGVVEAGVA